MKDRTLLVAVALSGLVALACGDGGGGAPSAPPPPPPPTPLSWSNVESDPVAIEVGETVEIELLLTAAVDATYSPSAEGEIVTLAGESPRAGVYTLEITGSEAGETTVTVTATAPGYTTATATITVSVTDPFQLSLWRELLFDEFDCPGSALNEGCVAFWGGRAVEDRITAVLPSQPNFHIKSSLRLRGNSTYRFSRSEIETIRRAIPNAVSQATGEPWAGVITSGSDWRDQNGWVDVAPIGDALSFACGLADVGFLNGTILLNVDALERCDLESVTVHEVGHALGFFHVLDLGDYIMSPHLTDIPPDFHEEEQYHARLGWELGRGARYTPDPRKSSSGAAATESGFGGPKTNDGLLRRIGRGELLMCRSD